MGMSLVFWSPLYWWLAFPWCRPQAKPLKRDEPDEN